eukprot:2160036-Ditylum_brightwellii.AAC.1
MGDLPARQPVVQFPREPISIAVLPTPVFPSRLSGFVVSMKIHTRKALAKQSEVGKGRARTRLARKGAGEGC